MLLFDAIDSFNYSDMDLFYSKYNSNRLLE